MGYWKSKILPKIKRVFGKNGTKKGAAEACKSFDDSRTIVKEPKEAGLKEHSAAVHNFLEELIKIEFPGSKAVFEASLKYGAALIPGPVLFIFEKVSTLIVVEDEPAAEQEPRSKEKAIVLEEEKRFVVVEEKAGAVAETAKEQRTVEPPKA